MRTDIDETQKQSEEIVGIAAGGEDLRNKAQDAASKVGLLKEEVAFNDSLLSTLQEIQALKQNVDAAQEFVLGARFLEAISLLKQSKMQLHNLRQRHASRAVDLIGVKVKDLESNVAETLTEAWTSLILVDLSDPSITIKQSTEGKHFYV